MTDRLINMLAADIAEMILPSVINPDGSRTVLSRKIEIERMLIEFANEIKREAIEP